MRDSVHEVIGKRWREGGEIALEVPKRNGDHYLIVEERSIISVC